MAHPHDSVAGVGAAAAALEAAAALPIAAVVELLGGAALFLRLTTGPGGVVVILAAAAAAPPFAFFADGAPGGEMTSAPADADCGAARFTPPVCARGAAAEGADAEALDGVDRPSSPST